MRLSGLVPLTVLHLQDLDQLGHLVSIHKAEVSTFGTTRLLRFSYLALSLHLFYLVHASVLFCPFFFLTLYCCPFLFLSFYILVFVIYLITYYNCQNSSFLDVKFENTCLNCSQEKKFCSKAFGWNSSPVRTNCNGCTIIILTLYTIIYMYIHSAIMT